MYDRKSEWGPSYFDLKHNFVASYVYSLPFGKGKAFGSSWNPVLNGALGDWQMGGILTMHTGFPLTVTANDVSGTKSRGPRANRIGNGEGAQLIGPGVKWLDTTAFSQRGERNVRQLRRGRGARTGNEELLALAAEELQAA